MGFFLQEYPINTVLPQCSNIASTFFLLYICDLPDDVICNIAIESDDYLLLNSTHYQKVTT